MSLISKPSLVTRSAVIYVTVGVLAVVWSIWSSYLLRDDQPSSQDTIYGCYGFLLTALALVLVCSNRPDWPARASRGRTHRRRQELERIIAGWDHR